MVDQARQMQMLEKQGIVMLHRQALEIEAEKTGDGRETGGPGDLDCWSTGSGSSTSRRCRVRF